MNPRQAVSFVSPIVIGLTLGATLGALNLIDTAVEPLADDRGGSMLAWAAAILLAWSAAGFFAARHTRRFGAAVKAGVIVAVATLVVFHAAAIVRVNVFLDVIQHHADWQNLVARFHASGFQSLRAYANYEYVGGIPFVLALGLIAGAVTGAIGGAVSGVHRNQEVPVPITSDFPTRPT